MSKTDHDELRATFEHATPNAANARARGAADRMWQKVEEDLERIDRLDVDDADDE